MSFLIEVFNLGILDFFTSYNYKQSPPTEIFKASHYSDVITRCHQPSSYLYTFVMDRDTKRLYRQRGSYQRTLFDPENDLLVIQTPSKVSPNNTTPLHYDNDIPAGLETPIHQNKTSFIFDNNSTIPENPLVDNHPTTTITPNHRQPFHDLLLPYQDGNSYNEPMHEEDEHIATIPPNYDLKFQFGKLPLRNLPISKISLLSINSLQHIYNHILNKILIRKATNDLIQDDKDKNSSSPQQKLMYKLDLRIFQNLLNLINKDFNDIKDINIANNELYYQLKKLKKRKVKVRTRLIEVRRQINDIKLNNDDDHLLSFREQNVQEQKLRKRLKLNKSLNKLSGILTKKNSSDGKRSIEKNKHQTKMDSLVKNNDNNLKQIDQLCDLLDPYNGMLSRLKSLNNELSKQK